MTGTAGDASFQQPSSSEPAAFVAFYWRAKPGRLDAYNEYIRSVAVPIDEDARRHNVFEELRTVMPAAGTTTDWTHLRIFRLKDAAAEQALAAGLDAATKRVVPDESRRKANSERSAGLRDLVRRAVWVPPGEHRVTLRYGPSLQMELFAISLLLTVGLAALGIWRLLQPSTRTPGAAI